MKIVRDDVAYMDLEDLRYLCKKEEVPKSVGSELPKELPKESTDFIKFLKEASINYLRNDDEIVDFDFVSNLTDAEIEEKIAEVESYIQVLLIKYQTTNDFGKQRLLNDKNYVHSLNKLKYIESSLVRFKENRVKYEVEFRNESLDRVLKKKINWTYPS